MPPHTEDHFNCTNCNRPLHSCSCLAQSLNLELENQRIQLIQQERMQQRATKIKTLQVLREVQISVQKEMELHQQLFEDLYRISKEQMDQQQFILLLELLRVKKRIQIQQKELEQIHKEKLREKLGQLHQEQEIHEKSLDAQQKEVDKLRTELRRLNLEQGERLRGGLYLFREIQLSLEQNVDEQRTLEHYNEAQRRLQEVNNRQEEQEQLNVKLNNLKQELDKVRVELRKNYDETINLSIESSS